jgi:hypothetical protein
MARNDCWCESPATPFYALPIGAGEPELMIVVRQHKVPEFNSIQNNTNGAYTKVYRKMPSIIRLGETHSLTEVKNGSLERSDDNYFNSIFTKNVSLLTVTI